jgi:hypothetical protein
MDEIISYKMCAVKVRNAKLRNYLNNTYVLKSPRESLMLSNLASNDNLTWMLLKLKMLWNVINSSSTLIIRHQ